MTTYSYKDGRIWYQRNKFTGYDLLLPYGMTNVTDPSGALTAVREPSASTRRKSVIVDIMQGEPALPEFQLETRLRKTLNLMLALKDCNVNFQCHMGACDRPDNYTASEMAFHWERSHRGDLTIDRMAIIEGDNAPVAMAVPWSAEIGPVPVDFSVEFLSARPIAESEAITSLAFLESECFEDCKSQEDAGKNGYAATAAATGSPTNIANVWYTVSRGESWAEVSSRPFAGGEDISSIVIMGSKNHHRVIVARGTADAGNPAEVAYADVTVMGTVTWVTANVGSVNGQYINKLLWLDSRHLYAVTNDGYIYQSSNNGASWTAIVTTATNAFYGIAGLSYGPNAGVIWAVGASNLVYLSLDYGATWNAVTGPTAGAGDDNTAVAVTPDGTMIMGNNAGEMFGTYDNGAGWTTLSAQGVVATAVDDIVCWGDSIIWAAVTTASGGRVVRSTDGGAMFLLWSLNIPTNAGLNALFAVDPNVVFVGGAPQGGTGFITRTTSQLLGI